ncbi:SKP1-like protein 1A [Ipomoea triloba]|uniref:SKP1-like protein 1A n=1 Tax=Ipomoea triloba TaxID=35885 RepID=UPI00125DF653|nr:SKP1-like protein 1A [Ipomoea triloba]
MSSSRMIVLKSSDGEMFEVEEKVALEMHTIKCMIDDDCVETTIPITNISGKILAMVIEYCKRHEPAVKTKTSPEAATSKEISPEAATIKETEEISPEAATIKETKDFDANFVKVDQKTLFDLIMAANFLDIKSLLDLTCQAVANMIENLSPEEVRATFNIQNDFTPEEEEAIRKENAWAFE